MKRILLFLPHSTWGRVLFCVVGVLAMALAFYNLEYYPRTWFDEGFHLQVARHLALTGDFRSGPAVGPTVFYPVAWVFRLFGVGLLQARLVMVGYLLFALAGFYLLVRRLYDAEVALIACVLLVTSNGVDLWRWGRQVLGEVPALAFFLWGSFCWFKVVDVATGRKRLTLALMAGVLLALSVLTKNQFVILVPVLVALWFLSWIYYRQVKPSYILLILACVGFCVAAWYSSLNFVADSRVVRHTVDQWQTAPARSILYLEPMLIFENIKFAFGTQAFFSWGLPGLLYGGLLALRRDRDGFEEAFLVVFALLWLTWYVVGSVGWERYASPGLAVTAVFVAKLFRDLIGDGGVSLRGVGESLQWGKSFGEARRLCFLAVLAAINLYPLGRQVLDIAFQVDRSPQQMASYLGAHVDQEAVIETWEPEMGFLTEHTYHYPPSQVLDVASRSVALGGSLPSGFYDFLEADPDYILVGEFGKWTSLYPAGFLERGCVLVTSIGAYDLYRVKK